MIHQNSGMNIPQSPSLRKHPLFEFEYISRTGKIVSDCIRTPFMSQVALMIERCGGQVKFIRNTELAKVCDHKTSETIAFIPSVELWRCTWGCNRYIVTEHGDGGSADLAIADTAAKAIEMSGVNELREAVKNG